MAENGGQDRNNDQHYHNDLYHWIYVFGATLLVGLMDFAFFWKDSHFAALLILATWIGLVSVYELGSRRWPVASIVGVIVLCYALAGIAGDYWPTLPEDTDREAYLFPSNKPTPHTSCDTNASARPPLGSVAIIIGSNEFWATFTKEAPVITLDDRAIISMSRSNKGLLFSVEMFDLTKKLVTKIKNNKATLIPERYSYKERSDGRSALTLYDDYGTEILYIDYLNPQAVLIRGVFTGPNGTTIAIDNDMIHRSIKTNDNFNHNCLGNRPSGISLAKHSLTF